MVRTALVVVMAGMILSVAGTAVADLLQFPISTATGNQISPAVSSPMVVWQDLRSGNYDIYGKNLVSGIEQAICINPSIQQQPAIYGNTVVWADNRFGVYATFGYDLSAPPATAEFLVSNGGGNESAPAISGNIVVWQDTRISGLNPSIFGRDLSGGLHGGADFVISSGNGAWSSTAPRISGNYVVWTDTRFGNQDIFGYNLATSTEFAICTNVSTQSLPSVSGKYVVWVDHRGGTNDIYGYDLSTNTEFSIVTNLASQSDPDVSLSGNMVVWDDLRGGSLDIYGYDLAAHAEVAISTVASNQRSPRIDGGVIVWQDLRNQASTGYDIYGTPEPATLSLLLLGGMAALIKPIVRRYRK